MQETDKVEVPTDVKTVTGQEFVITTTPTGYYMITTTATGVNPAISQERFTTIEHARRALNVYKAENAPAILKRQVMDEGIKRRKAKLVEGED